MEWLKNISLRKFLSVLIIFLSIIGVGLHFLTSLILNIVVEGCTCWHPFYWVIHFITAIIIPIIAAAVFYHIKLKAPMSQLAMGAKRIMENDLDFSIKVNSKDELGQLCNSFELMRTELAKSNRTLWQQMEERKRLNAAFAHDLRNPVTVLKGSAMILQKGLEQDNLKNAEESIALITQYSARIERYIQAMTSVQKLEDLWFAPKKDDWFSLAKSLKNSLSILGTNAGKRIEFISSGENNPIYVDGYIVHNVAENIVSNALRYAEDSIVANMSCDSEKITISVSDDGPGFSSAVLKKGASPFLRDDTALQGEHFGMGLYICRLLCEKHGGSLTLENHTGGAKTTAEFILKT